MKDMKSDARCNCNRACLQAYHSAVLYCSSRHPMHTDRHRGRIHFAISQEQLAPHVPRLLSILLGAMHHRLEAHCAFSATASPSTTRAATGTGTSPATTHVVREVAPVFGLHSPREYTHVVAAVAPTFSLSSRPFQT